MNPKLKKGLIIGAIVLDAAITTFLFTVAMIMLATLQKRAEGMTDTEWVNFLISKNGPFIGGLQANPTLYLCSCVIPLFVLIVANIVLLVVYVKKAGKKKAVSLSELSAEDKEALKAELLKDISKE